MDIASRYQYPDAGLPCLTPRDRLSLMLQFMRYREVIPHLSKFNFHLRSTLETIFGSQAEGCLQNEPITSAGLSADVEMLFGEGNKPISLPACGQNLRYEEIRDHLAAKYGINLSDIDLRIDKFQPRGDVRSLINLASDWDIVKSAIGEDIHRRVVFEANGPNHYAINNPRHWLGKMVLKQEQLEAQGWEVIHVSVICSRLLAPRPHTLWNLFLELQFVLETNVLWNLWSVWSTTKSDTTQRTLIHDVGALNFQVMLCFA